MSGSDPPGLQHERTALAWQHTGLAMLANGALLLLHHPPGQGPRLAPAALAGLLAALTWALGRRRRRVLRERPVDAVVLPVRYAVTVATGLVALTVLVQFAWA